MKKMLISVASAILMLGTASAREVVVSPIAPSRPITIAIEHRVAQFNSTGEGGIPCTAEYIPTRDDRGWYLRKDVDCEE
jgi:opacity protein-like surface antigen